MKNNYNKKEKHIVSVRVDIDIYDKMVEISQDEDRSVSNVLHVLLKEALRIRELTKK